MLTTIAKEVLKDVSYWISYYEDIVPKDKCESLIAVTKNSGQLKPSAYANNSGKINLILLKDIGLPILNLKFKDKEIKNLLASKFNRVIIGQLLNVNLVEIEEILINCNYSNAFIKNANDLQILEEISECYNEYRVLNL